MKKYFFACCLSAVFAPLLFSFWTVARADAVAHFDRPMTRESTNLLAEFKENCRKGELANGVSTEFRNRALVVTEKRTSRLIAHVDRLRLTDIWISPDERFVVGLSHVKAQAGPLLVIVGRNGAIAGMRRIYCDFPFVPLCGESVSNYRDWYNHQNPGIELIEEDGVLVAIALNADKPLDAIPEDLKSEEERAVPGRFIVPLTCRLNDVVAAGIGLSVCKGVGLDVPGTFDTEEFEAALAREWVELRVWSAQNSLEDREPQAAFAELDNCLQAYPRSCACGHKLHDVLVKLNNTEDAKALRDGALPLCRTH